MFDKFIVNSAFYLPSNENKNSQQCFAMNVLQIVCGGMKNITKSEVLKKLKEHLEKFASVFDDYLEKGKKDQMELLEKMIDPVENMLYFLELFIKRKCNCEFD
jgi:hypothetical protein